MCVCVCVCVCVCGWSRGCVGLRQFVILYLFEGSLVYVVKTRVCSDLMLFYHRYVSLNGDPVLVCGYDAKQGCVCLRVCIHGDTVLVCGYDSKQGYVCVCVCVCLHV